MANDAGNNIEFWISVPANHKGAIYELRQWSYLKIAQDQSLIWIRGFNQGDIESSAVLKIPSINRFYLSGTNLVPYGKNLSALVEPNLLWSPIQRGLKISLPKENFNYFGLNQTYQIALTPTDEVKPINAIIVKLKTLANYIDSAPNIRLINLKWTIISDSETLILGTPLLPIKSKDLYQNNSFLIPAGWKLKHDNMIKIHTKALGEAMDYFYLINKKHKITKIRKSDFNQLSKGSFAKTIK